MTRRTQHAHGGPKRDVHGLWAVLLAALIVAGYVWLRVTFDG